MNGTDLFPTDKTELREYNLRKYKVEPSWLLVQQTIKKSGLKFMQRFETAFGLPHRTLLHMRSNYRSLAPKYWHIFYDFDKLKKQHEQQYKRVSKNVSNNENAIPIPYNKNVLNEQRQRAV